MSPRCWRRRFWEAQHGAIAEEFNADWSPIAPYHGQNSNMHLTEALMAAFEATGEREYLEKAEQIADLIINRRARENGFRVAEHFDADWNVDKAYAGDPMFRPPGTTPGHWLEWARLVLQLWALGGKQHAWMPEAARSAVPRSRSPSAGTRSTAASSTTSTGTTCPTSATSSGGRPREGIGAAAFLIAHRPSEFHETWYRKIWDVIARHHLDEQNGGWFEQLSEDMRPANSLFPGKGDIYHALQACLIPLYPAEGSVTKGIIEAHGKA